MIEFWIALVLNVCAAKSFAAGGPSAERRRTLQVDHASGYVGFVHNQVQDGHRRETQLQNVENPEATYSLAPTILYPVRH